MKRARPSPTMPGHRALGTAVAFACATLGCGSDSSGDKTPVEVYAGQYADAKCGVMETCCADNGLTLDQSQCRPGTAGYVQKYQVDPEVQAGASFNANAADVCISRVVDATKKCILEDQDPASRKACAIVWSGPKKVGDSCTGDIDCESSNKGRGVCLGAVSGATGTCVIQTRGTPANLGDVCGKTANGPVPATIADCDGSGFQCNLLSQTCSPLVSLGGSCGEFNRCDKGLFCDDTGVCATALGTGAACSKNAEQQCASGLCITGKCAANGIGAPLPCTGHDQ